MTYDRWLFLAMALLALGGLFMVGSSSNYEAMRAGADPSVFLYKHMFHLTLGFVALLTMLSFDYRKLAHGPLMVLLLGLCVTLLVLVLAMPEAGGARRWFQLGPFRFQPAEFVKLFGVLFVAYLLARKEERIREFWAVAAPVGVVIGGLAFLIVVEPDLGSAVMLVLPPAILLFAAGLAWRHIAIGGVLGAGAFALAVIQEPYRLRRIASFFDPTADVFGRDFQLQQSLIALGNGGLTGTGLGQGHQKAFYLPAAHTDFIFSVVGEEIGLLGTSLLLVAFLLIFWRGMRAALRAPDRFGFYLALGITHLLVLQALINMGVCLGMLPTKGLPLPFISYGGSSLLASMMAMGLLLNVSQHSN